VRLAGAAREALLAEKGSGPRPGKTLTRSPFCRNRCRRDDISPGAAASVGRLIGLDGPEQYFLLTAGGLRPVRGKPASDLLWRLADRDCLMGVQLGLMGVQLGGKVIWAGLRGCGCAAGTAGQQREAVTMPPR